MILKLMLSHHALIETYLTFFLDSLKKPEVDSIFYLDKFRWELTKHIFVEDQIIFKNCELASSEICGVAKNLENDHITMLVLLQRAEADLSAHKEVDLAEFQALLRRHREVEEKILYPKLDEQLSEVKKEEIVSKVNEITLK